MYKNVKSIGGQASWAKMMSEGQVAALATQKFFVSET